jgi:hypothetical protein
MEGAAASEMAVICAELHDITSPSDHNIEDSNDYVALALYRYTTS